MPSIPVNILKLAVSRAKAKSAPFPDIGIIAVIDEAGLEFRARGGGFTQRHTVSWIELESWHDAAVQALLDAKLDIMITNLRKAIDDGSA